MVDEIVEFYQGVRVLGGSTLCLLGTERINLIFLLIKDTNKKMSTQ
jgi:hypothetical protein